MNGRTRPCAVGVEKKINIKIIQQNYLVSYTAPSGNAKILFYMDSNIYWYFLFNLLWYLSYLLKLEVKIELEEHFSNLCDFLVKRCMKLFIPYFYKAILNHF